MPVEREIRPDLLKKLKNGGLYTGATESSFETANQVKRNLAVRGDIPRMSRVETIQPKEVNDYLDAATQRATQMKDLSTRSENQIKVDFPDDTVVHVMGDLHFGHPNTDNERIKREVEAIKNTEGHYVLFDGDIVDGIFWGGQSGAEQSANINEQHGFLRSLFRGLRDKIVAGISGEHDSKWAGKSGSDPYDIMQGETGAPYVRGTAEIEAQVGDQDYKIVAAHKARGHSMYNKNHPTFRQARFNLQGGDVYVSAHTHQKQVSQETVREFGGAREVTHISIGPYKTGDEYGDRSGFIEQKPEEMGGASFKMHADKKKVEVEPDILTAIKRWSE